MSTPSADPVVSLLMPTYDERPDWLREAVTSALAQSGCSIELIVVDDGSPTPASEILADVEDPRLEIRRVQHAGGAEARNAAIDVARGSYVRFLDSDDVFPPDSTATLLALASSKTERMIACGATRWCREDLSIVWDWSAGCPRYASRAYLLQRCAPMLPSFLFPISVVEEVGRWEQRCEPCGDTDFILRALEHAPVVETREITAWYRQHATSISKNGPAFSEAMLLIVERYFERHPDERGGKLGRQVDSMLDVLSADIAYPSFPWAHPLFWRALTRDPGTLRLVAKGHVEPRLKRTLRRFADPGGFVRRRWRRRGG